MIYEYNTEALRAIRRHLDMRIAYVHNQSGVPRSTYKSWEDGTIPTLADLLKVCNALRVNIFNFISTNGKLKEEDVIMPERYPLPKYKKMVFNHNVMAVYLNKEMKMPIATICERLGISTPSYYRYFPSDPEEKSVMQIDTYLKACNVFHLWPGSFLTEHSEDIPVLDGYVKAEVMRENNNIRLMNKEERELAKIRKTLALANSNDPIDALEKQYRLALDEKLRELREKHERSLDRHKKIENRLNTRLRDALERIEDLEMQLRTERRLNARLSNGMYSIDQDTLIAKVAEDEISG